MMPELVASPCKIESLKHELLLILVLLWAFDLSNAYDWASGSNGQVMWSSGCDFYGNDIGSTASSGEDCGGICARNANCDHFTWYNGVCYMKAAVNPPVNDLNGAVCGWVTNRGISFAINNLNCKMFNQFKFTDGGGPTVPTKATYWALHSDPGGCQLPGTVNYAVTDALALGQATSLGNLIWRQGLCGQVLSVNCGNGVVNAVVASTCNLGSSSCGVDLIAQTWNKATSNQSPGIAQCQVAHTQINPMHGASSLCFYRPNSPNDNQYYASLGVFNTNGRIPSSATLGSIQGTRDSGDSYFTFNGLNSGLTVTFTFEDGSSSPSFPLSSCRSGGSTYIF